MGLAATLGDLFGPGVVVPIPVIERRLQARAIQVATFDSGDVEENAMLEGSAQGSAQAYSRTVEFSTVIVHINDALVSPFETFSRMESV